MPCKPCQVGASSLCMIVEDNFLWHGDAQACTQECVSTFIGIDEHNNNRTIDTLHL